MSTAATPAAEAAAPDGKKKKMIMIALVLALAGAAYFFVLKPAPADAEGAEPEREPGEVLALEPVQINLAGGHYLRIGIALQLAADLAHGADGSKALDATIDLFSGLPIEHVTQAKHRKELKKELNKELDHLYHGDVLEVFFTDFVTQ